jgi:hypothetical protein
VRKGIETGVDTVLIDTAGRLQNKVGLMDELGKVKRVVEKHGPVDEIDVGFISDTERGAKSQGIIGEISKHLGHKTPALRGHADKAGSTLKSHEGRVELATRVCHPDTVWA